jgi:hypothetical protein
MKTPFVRNARLQYRTATIEIAAGRNPWVVVNDGRPTRRMLPSLERVAVDYLQGTTR